jgi:hypothetical protein
VITPTDKMNTYKAVKLNKQLKYNKRWQRLNKSPLISVKDWYFFLQYISLPSHLTLQLNENEIQIYKKDDIWMVEETLMSGK